MTKIGSYYPCLRAKLIFFMSKISDRMLLQMEKKRALIFQMYYYIRYNLLQ